MDNLQSKRLDTNYTTFFCTFSMTFIGEWFLLLKSIIIDFSYIVQIPKEIDWIANISHEYILIIVFFFVFCQSLSFYRHLEGRMKTWDHPRQGGVEGEEEGGVRGRGGVPGGGDGRTVRMGWDDKGQVRNSN